MTNIRSEPLAKNLLPSRQRMVESHKPIFQEPSDLVKLGSF
jgi:hypothetical protein